MTAPETDLDPAVAVLLSSLEHQRDELFAIRGQLDVARDSTLLLTSRDFWAGLAERAQSSAIAELWRLMQSANSALERASDATAVAISEVRGRVR